MTALLSRVRWSSSLASPAIGAFLAAAVWFAPAARADDLEQAKQWVAEGDKAEAAHDYPTAIAKYRKALGVKESAQLYLRVGLVQEEAGLLADALRSYQAARPLAVGNDKVLGVVDQSIDKVRLRVPYIGLTLSETPQGLRVDVDHQQVTDLAGETPVNPGAVEIHVAAPGRADVTRSVRISPGEHQRVAITLPPVTGPQKPVQPPPPPSAQPSVPGIVLLSLGAVGLAAGAGVLAQGFVYQSDIAAKCGDPAGNPPSYQCMPGVMVDGQLPDTIVSRSNTFKTAGGVTLAAGGALAIVGGVLLGVSLAKHDRPTAIVVPIVGPGVAGATFAGAF